MNIISKFRLKKLTIITSIIVISFGVIGLIIFWKDYKSNSGNDSDSYTIGNSHITSSNPELYSSSQPINSSDSTTTNLSTSSLSVSSVISYNGNLNECDLTVTSTNKNYVCKYIKFSIPVNWSAKTTNIGSGFEPTTFDAPKIELTTGAGHKIILQGWYSFGIEYTIPINFSDVSYDIDKYNTNNVYLLDFFNASYDNKCVEIGAKFYCDLSGYEYYENPKDKSRYVLQGGKIKEAVYYDNSYTHGSSFLTNFNDITFLFDFEKGCTLAEVEEFFKFSDTFVENEKIRTDY